MGVGTLLQCCEKNFPLVMPRRVEFNEHLNNHQLDILMNLKTNSVNIEKISF